jgi:arginase
MLLSAMPAPAILGVPFDAQSSFMRGAALAPAKIREAFHSDASNKWSETGFDIGAKSVLHDFGDLHFSTTEGAFAEIESGVLHLLERHMRPIILGGDHSITFPILRAIAQYYPKLTIVHFDAHPDLYDSYEGNRHSHACPFARIMENNLASELIQIGIRTLNGHQREQAARFGVKQFLMDGLPASASLRVQGPVYISFDLDVLDPAFAPGVSHREPGGISVRDAIQQLHAINSHVVGADIVEYNPSRDVDGMTSIVAAKLLKEIAGVMIRNDELSAKELHHSLQSSKHSVGQS